MGNYAELRSWSDQFIPAIRSIVGPLLLEPAVFELDAKEATDLMVFNARDMRVAARVRRKEYADRYPFEFTIRSALDSGTETEFSKIVKGYGDWLFYGFEGGTGAIERWSIIDLHSFRAALIMKHRHMPACEKKSNGDGTHFLAFDVRSFLPEQKILVASSHPIEALAA